MLQRFVLHHATLLQDVVTASAPCWAQLIGYQFTVKILTRPLSAVLKNFQQHFMSSQFRQRSRKCFQMFPLLRQKIGSAADLWE